MHPCSRPGAASPHVRRDHRQWRRVGVGLLLVSLAGAVSACGGSSTGPGTVAQSSGTAAPAPAAPRTTEAAAPSVFVSPAPVGPAGQVLTAAVRTRLAVELRRLRATHHLPGVQVVVRLPDGEAWSAHAGFADVAAHTTVSPTTLFDAGSITKTFVAALTLQLAGEGVLGLDDPITRWLPTFSPGRGVTIRELLSHTSGIGEPFDNRTLLSLLGSHPDRAWTVAAVLHYAATPTFTPGHGWLYSNANYLLLGQIIEAATGRPVATLLEQRFFAPLGLDHTFLQGQAPAPASEPLAHGYEAATDTTWAATDVTGASRYLPFTSLATALGTAGGLVTTADDLSHWAEALYGGHVLPATSLAEMLDFGLTRGLHPRWPYGLGAQQVTLLGQVSWGHSGLLSGFHAAMRYFPATGASIVVLVNADATNPDTLVSGLLRALGPLPPASP
jgi:D-alanyl-D-alanine carboxypeptidase